MVLMKTQSGFVFDDSREKETKKIAGSFDFTPQMWLDLIIPTLE